MFSGADMKKLATAIAAIALVGTPALAADIAVKAAAPSPAPVYNWTGWYAGVNLGAASKPTSTPPCYGGGEQQPRKQFPYAGFCWLQSRVSRRLHRWWSNRIQLAG